jgi:hypothetical protein
MITKASNKINNQSLKKTTVKVYLRATVETNIKLVIQIELIELIINIYRLIF